LDTLRFEPPFGGGVA